MTHILVSGLATVDMIYYMEDLPTRGQKYRAENALITGVGNASNSSVAISRMGGSVTLLTIIGQDAFGELIIEELKAEKVKTNAIIRKPDFETPYSSVIVDKKGNRQIVNYRSSHLDFSFHKPSIEGEFQAYLTDGRLREATLFTLEEARKKK